MLSYIITEEHLNYFKLKFANREMLSWKRTWAIILIPEKYFIVLYRPGFTKTFIVQKVAGCYNENIVCLIDYGFDLCHKDPWVTLIKNIDVFSDLSWQSNISLSTRSLLVVYYLWNYWHRLYLEASYLKWRSIQYYAVATHF